MICFFNDPSIFLVLPLINESEFKFSWQHDINRFARSQKVIKRSLKYLSPWLQFLT